MRKRKTMDSTVKARKAELVWTSTESSVRPPRFPDTAHYSCEGRGQHWTLELPTNLREVNSAQKRPLLGPFPC